MSIVNIPVEQIKALPALLGEVDVLKAVQMLLESSQVRKEEVVSMLEVEARIKI